MQIDNDENIASFAPNYNYPIYDYPYPDVELLDLFVSVAEDLYLSLR